MWACLPPRAQVRPWFRCRLHFSMRQQWFTHVRLLIAHLTRSWRALSATLTTPALDRRSLRWFGTSPCRAIPEGQPPSLVQHASDSRSTPSSVIHFQDTPPDRCLPCARDGWPPTPPILLHWKASITGRTYVPPPNLRPPAPVFGQAPDQDVPAWTDGRRVAEVRKFGTGAKPPVNATDVVSFKLSCQYMPLHPLSVAPAFGTP